MVVLEGGGGIVTIGNNQYLQPDYLSPLSSSMDSKKSPLALLAQTCSQIGADSSAVKPILSLDKKKSSDSSSSSSSSKSPTIKGQKSSTPCETKLAFKPYETNVLSHTSLTNNNNNNNNINNNTKLENNYSSPVQRPNSRISASVGDNNDDKMNGTRIPSRNKSDSPEISVTNGHNNSEHCGKMTPSENCKSVSPAGSSQRGASPIIRSGLEVLQGGSGRDISLSAYKNAYGLNPLSALYCQPGMEQHTNPAFRPPFAGSLTHHHAAMLAAAAANGYPGGSSANPNPYISYQRIKTPSGGETIIPVCKDPYCPGCPYSAHTQQMLMGAPCPSGCTQCEHQKYSLAMAASLGSLPPGHPYASQVRSPYVCSWITSDSYCGKRFNTSDELFTHLRTHTGNLSDPATAAAALAQSQAQSLLGSLFPQRAYPTQPLSPMSAAAAAAAASRYHPYAKHGGLPTAMSGSPFSAAFNPSAAAALGPYYSPYAMYGQRIGSAAVHP